MNDEKQLLEQDRNEETEIDLLEILFAPGKNEMVNIDVCGWGIDFWLFYIFSNNTKIYSYSENVYDFRIQWKCIRFI